VVLDLLGETFADLLGEVADQVDLAVGVVGQVGLDQLVGASR